MGCVYLDNLTFWLRKKLKRHYVILDEPKYVLTERSKIDEATGKKKV